MNIAEANTIVAAPTSAHYTEIAHRYHDSGLRAYFLSLTYRSANCPKSVSAKLRRTAPVLFSELISRHWQRQANRGEIVLLAFLDVPATRSGRVTPFAASYHHHGILLVHPRACARLAALFDHHRDGIELTNVPTLRTKLEERGVQTCYLQPLPLTEDVEKAAIYAAKAVRAISRTFPDDAVTIFP